MFDLSQLNNEINMMKSETLSRYGKKVDIICTLIEKEKHFLARNEKILIKIEKKIPLLKRKKKKIYDKVLENVQNKTTKSKIKIEKMLKLKEKYINEYKTQREALGILDHTFIDEFYD
ncbi:hypothetical protein LF845_10480 [Deferribacterales bacterium Es71-Z0220]|jgi:hypothetical protein|uniref:hypothetical protein n=1 Tax=Deferrivibrio essentukiensis TaxID=2880922 RepID=UPI001F60C3C2|nr:hypothetical protein [Deferrivibrio essentukiensis]MCB4205380.1 hypothetical protein [Deferrivibrio essentukiensis]